MLAMIVAPGQYVRPRMLFVFELRTKGLSTPKLRCYPSLDIREGLWIVTRCGISVPQAKDGPPSALVHRCYWIRRFLAIDAPLGIDRTCLFRSLVASPRWPGRAETDLEQRSRRLDQYQIRVSRISRSLLRIGT